MSLYIRLETSFWTHRKTLRLRAILGNDALWIPPRIWAYAAQNQPDGCFKDYSSEELAMLIGYSGDAQAMLEAMLKVGFMDSEPLRIHDWHEFNGILDFFSKRARKAADVRWEKERSKEKGSDQIIAKQSRSEQSIASSSASSSASSICPVPSNDGNGIPVPRGTSPIPKNTKRQEVARPILHYLNEKAGRQFRETDINLTLIAARCEEVKDDLAGVRQMIDRQCARWKGDPKMSEYLRPETLFGKTKFSSYYDNRTLPIQTEARFGNSTINRRNAGIIIGPTDYANAKPRLQREREEAERRAAEAALAGQVAEPENNTPAASPP